MSQQRPHNDELRASIVALLAARGRDRPLPGREIAQAVFCQPGFVLPALEYLASVAGTLELTQRGWRLSEAAQRDAERLNELV